MLCTYEELLEGYNSSVPVALALPRLLVDRYVRIDGGTANMVVDTSSEQVSKIIIQTEDDKIENSAFYQMFVNGLEGGMGWSSANFYHAMMGTLKDHQEHIGQNSLGVTVIHSWKDGLVTLEITR